MNTWLPQYKALWMAENCTGTLHNLYTLRGAEVRDGAAWASYITEAISLYGKDVPAFFYWLGSGFTGRENAPWHSPDFEADDNALAFGAQLLARSAALALEE